MRTDTALFAQKNVALEKEPRYVIELAFDEDNTILRYFPSHADAALPPGAAAIATVLEGLSVTSQTLNPDTANATIGTINYSLADKAGIVTATLGGQLELGRSTRRQRVRVYAGYEGLAWDDYTLVQTQLLTEVGVRGGAYRFSCADIQREMRKEIFDPAKTTLASSLSATATTVPVSVGTGSPLSAFELVAHGTSYSDAPSATVGYIRIEDEIIRYTSKDAAGFTGCTRGALNTRAVEHAVDPATAAERRLEIAEYHYLELPAVKAIYALLTGKIYWQDYLSLPGTAGNYASTPESAANSVTDDIDLRCKAALIDWTPAIPFMTFVAKWDTAANQRAYRLRITDASALQLLWSENGTAVKTAQSTVAMSVADGVTKWVRATLDVNNGAGGNDVKFYTSDDGSAWTQLGATVTTAGITSIFDSNAILEIGSGTTGAQEVLQGRIYYAEVRNGIGGTVVASFDPNRFVVGALTAVMLTGELWTVNQSGSPAAAIMQAYLPVSWHLGIPLAYARLADFTGIGADLWDTADDQQGRVVLLQDLKKTDGKKFIETELARLCGAFLPVYADGALGIKRRANILSGAAYVAMLDESNVVSVGELVHDYNSVHNVLRIDWNWEPLLEKFTRPNLLIDADSRLIYGKAEPLEIKSRALHGSRHTSVTLQQMFDSLRDAYTGPPLRLPLVVSHRLNTLEVGDVVRVRLDHVPDFTLPGGGGPIDRSFEIQNISIDWITGNVALKLFGSSRAPGAVAATGDTTVLTQAWYTGTGTALASVLTITGSNPGHVSSNGNLAGHADMNNAAAIYYYDGDLQVDAGVTVTVNNNVQLRVRGFLQNNGKLDGKGRGIAGAAAVTDPPTSFSHYNPGTAGFIGATEAGGGLSGAKAAWESTQGGSVSARNAVVPDFTLDWDGSALSGLPADLRGTSGSSGMPVVTRLNTFNPLDPPLTLRAGGAGGAGGAGLMIVSRGFAQGAAGSIDLSGGDGAEGGSVQPSGILGARYFAGSGAGGAPGGLLVLLDGALQSATGLTEAGCVALQGKTPIRGTQTSEPGFARAVAIENYSYFAGTGDGTSFDLPSLSGTLRGGARVQYVTGNPGAVADPLVATLPAPSNFGLASDTVAQLLVLGDGTILPRIQATWTPVPDSRVAGYELQFKASTESAYQALPPVLGRSSAEAWVLGAKDGVNNDVQLRSAGRLREVSEWVTITGHFFTGRSGQPAPPGIPVVVEEIYDTSGSAGVKSRANASWGASSNPFVNRYILEWKPAADPAYHRESVSGLSKTLDDLAPGDYLFRSVAVTGFGFESVPSTALAKEIIGLNAPPADATGFSVIASNGFAVSRWDLSSDLDVKIGGRAIVRHSPLTTGAVWEDGILISGSVALPGFPGDTIMSPPLPLKSGTYLLKFRDSTGNYSLNAASFVATEGMITGFTTLVTITEDAAFSGAKTDTVVNGSNLQLASVNMLQRTEQFDNAAWSKFFGASIVADAGVAPDGTTTADKIVFDGTVNGQVAQGVNGLVIGNPYTFSVYVKTDGTTQQPQKLYIGGTVQAFTPNAAWTRISLLRIAAATTESPLILNEPNVASSFLAWGAQFEKGSVASAYDKLVADRIGSVITPSGSYDFAATDDRGSIAVRRFEATIKAVSFDTGDTIDSRTANIDTWDSIDGGVVNDCNAQLYASVSDDNITYKPYTPFHVADFSGRYSKFRLDLSSANSNHSIAISQLRVAIKVP